MLGSLNEFIDSEEPKISAGSSVHDELIVPISRHSRKKVLEERKKKSKVRMSEYIPADKKYLMYTYDQNYKAHLPVKSSIIEPEKNYVTGRRSIGESRISSMFHGSSNTPLKEPNEPQNLKREHNLLRAIARTKLSQTEKIKISEYEESFQRMVEGLGKVSVKPIVEERKILDIGENRTFRSIQIAKNQRNKSQISNRKRIEFENCLSWSKKHKKNGSFYSDQLGKNIQQENKNASMEKRKQILDSIHQRSSSFSFSEKL